MIRVLIVDDQRLLREGMKMLLSFEQDLLVVGEAGDGAEGVAMAVSLEPDVVLMDVRMPVMNGVEATTRLREVLPKTRVLMLTTFDDDDLVIEALSEGARGYLTKDLPAEQIADAVRKVHAGGAVMPPPIAAKVVAELAKRMQAATVARPAQPALTDLTDRELEVLRLLAQGFSNREIADALFIAEGTAKNHVSSIIDKLSLRDRTQAALWAVRNGMLDTRG